MIRADILDEAKRIVTQDRNRQYGPPEDLFAAIGMIWMGLDLARGDRALNAVDVGLYLVGLKLARASANQGHRDSFVDGAGYLACAGEIAGSDAFLAAITEGALRNGPVEALGGTLQAREPDGRRRGNRRAV